MEQHTRRTSITIGIIIVFVAAGACWYIGHSRAPAVPAEPHTPSAPATTTPTQPLPPNTGGGTGTQQVSTGVLLFAYQQATFGLATDSEHILVKSYIPPCGDGTSNFDYCLYYTGTAYDGTNFESAGLRIQKRADLTTETSCLQTPPAGYGSSVHASGVYTGVGYTTSGFWPVGDAGAGHSASGELYRLAYTEPLTGDLICYEFETRIGTTQFGNYPEGSIKEFTTSDRAAVAGTLRGILEHITLPNDTLLKFPHPADRGNI